MLDARTLKRTVGRAMRGDIAAAEKLIKAYLPTIVYQASLKLADREDVEDAAQEIAIIVAGSIGGLSSAYAFNAWLQGIISNVCMARNDKLIRRQARMEYLPEETDIVDEDLQVMPEEVFMKNVQSDEQQAALHSILGDLPDAQKDALVMRYLYKMSYKEIAHMQSISIKTVGSTISRARENLRERITAAPTEQREMLRYSVAGGMLGSAALSQLLSDNVAFVASSANLSALADTALAQFKLAGIVAAGATAAGATAAGAASSSASAAAASGSASAAGASAAGGTASAGGASAGSASTLTLGAKALVSACLTSSLALGGVAMVVTGELDVVMAEGSYEQAQGVIGFRGGGSAEHINPTVAELALTTPDWQIESWAIIDAAEKVQASGTGTSVELGASSLASGTYKISWKLVLHKQEMRTNISRQFVVEAPGA